MRLLLTVVGTFIAGAAVGAGVVLYEPWSSESSSVSRGVYVVSATTGTVVKLDPNTRVITDTIDLEAAHLSTVAVAGDRLYYGTWDGSRSSIGRYNLATEEREPMFIGQDFYKPLLHASPAQPDMLFIGEQGLSPANIQKWSVPSDGGEPELLARTEHGPMGSNLQDFEISDDGTKIWSACGSPYEFVELNTSDLALSGRIYRAVPYPTSVDSVSVGGTEYLLAGTNSDTGSTQVFETTGDMGAWTIGGDAMALTEPGSVALSPDASKSYRVAPVANDAVPDDIDATLETLSTDDGRVLATTHVQLSQDFLDAIQPDPVTGMLFISLQHGVGVFDPDGTLVEIVPVAAAGQIVIT